LKEKWNLSLEAVNLSFSFRYLLFSIASPRKKIRKRKKQKRKERKKKELMKENYKEREKEQRK